jgi:Zn-dependent peptidase ImmA (M78 family)
MQIRRKLIRSQTSELLAKFQISAPPVPVDKIAERLGIHVVGQPADDDISGFLLRDRQGKVVIGFNDKHHINRQRFTIGHEVGHFLLHKGEDLHVDETGSGYEVRLRQGHSSEATDVDELEANLFSAELLMPAEFLEADLTELAPLCLADDDKIRKLAAKYKVSAQALTLRLTHLGYIRC